MTDHAYTIRLEPRGKGRPVFSRASGSARTPQTTRAWEHEAAHQLREQHTHDGTWDGGWPLWEVDVTAYHRRPKSRPAYIPKSLWSLPAYSLPATSRHDLDNIVKIVLDALQIARVIDNDRCIVSINAGSYYAAAHGEERVEVVLREVML
jgi:Holliday junction resolvase RusA-like endonuclease